MKLKEAIWLLVGLFLPAAPEDPEVPDPTPETPPADSPAESVVSAEEGTPSDLAQSEENQAALAQAADLEAKNQRIADLEAKASDEAVEARAFDLLKDFMPEMTGNAPQEAAPTPQQPFAEIQNQEALDPGVEMTLEERVDRVEDNFARSHNERIIEREMESLEGQLAPLQGKFPHMNRREVLMIVANAGENEVDLSRVAEASHKSRLHELESYHRSKLADMGQHAPPPTLDPTQSAGPPIPAVKVTSKNAASVLAERLTNAGWGKGK